MDSKVTQPTNEFLDAGVNEYGEPNLMIDIHQFHYWFSWKTPTGFRYDCIKSGCEGRLYWYPNRDQKMPSIKHNCRNTPPQTIKVSISSVGSG
jgi:hypothetical protein